MLTSGPIFHGYASHASLHSPFILLTKVSSSRTAIRYSGHGVPATEGVGDHRITSGRDGVAFTAGIGNVQIWSGA